MAPADEPQLKRGAFEQIELFEYAIAAPLDDGKLLMVNEALETVNTDQEPTALLAGLPGSQSALLQLPLLKQ